ncbi:TIGR04283 family arsenosugar biosynthesis glycosyltransferase [Pseudozobellia sp. WGM2]|uniref:TIGR04283 family arsenosugar biosynthesis glycosyltransferase n=1 Tax=Pseudozobellia sp. WGM2 TaxID=2787625 RepID=UPI001ADED302|nr:TIGR04283 family arsenosugar biosynthesis glycosyltransferase [Pseudozobellia sp. WGM2]
MVSIIIPAHNERENLENLLPKLLSNAKARQIEIIVVLSDTNSDLSEHIDFGDRVSIIKSSVKGRAAQMNIGEANASNNILAFLHADVLPPDEFIADIEKTLNDNYDAGFFSYRFDKENWLLKVNASFTARDGIFTGGGDQCLFIKKNVFNDLGRFDEKQVLMEDFEFFERMKKERIPYKIINNDLIVSARKYNNNSYLRVNLSNLLLVILFKFGYPPEKLKILHNKLLKAPAKKTLN